MNISREDLDIELSTSPWGGEVAKVKVLSGALVGRTFWLRSTAGLGHEMTEDLERGGGIHVDAADPNVDTHSWRGAFRTFSMHEAIDSLVDYINELALRQRVDDLAYGLVYNLADAVEGLKDSLRESSPRDLKTEWQNVCMAVVALQMRLQEAGVDIS